MQMIKVEFHNQLHFKPYYRYETGLKGMFLSFLS